MHWMLATRSELIAIPEGTWSADHGNGAAAEVAVMAMAIERRRAKRVPLPRESERYALVCARLSEMARELAEAGIGTRVWTAESAAVCRWATLADQLPQRARPIPTQFQIGLVRARSTFVPPAQVAS